jgi:signal transduction histidine kinase
VPIISPCRAGDRPGITRAPPVSGKAPWAGDRAIDSLARLAVPATLSAVSLRTRFNLLFLSLLVGLIASLLVIDHLQDRQWLSLARTEKAKHEHLLRELLALRSESTRQFANDYGKWDETFSFVTDPTPAFAHDNLEAALPTFRLNRLWIFKPDGSLVYSVAAPLGAPAPGSPLPATALRQLFRQPAFSFFLPDPAGLLEIHGASIVPTPDSDRHTPPVGFIVAAQRWDDKTLAQIAPIAQGELTLHPPDRPVLPDPHLASIPLLGHDGAVASHLTLRFSLKGTSIVATTDVYELVALVIIGLTVLLVIGSRLRRWILNPLDLIGRCLGDGSLEPLGPLLARPDEVGRLASLARHSAQQQAQLAQSLADRSQLSRALHDGAIQAIYATGLNLASARTLLAADPARTAVLLEQARTSLNDVIRDLRRSIAGLDPELNHGRPFSAVLSSLLPASNGAPHVVSAIDAPLAERLPLPHRAQLLQFAREALTNAHRHAHAREIRLTLRPDAAGLLFEISDDGIGFDPARVVPGGRGLANLAIRARDLGATFTLRSSPGTGTTVSLLLPSLP